MFQKERACLAELLELEPHIEKGSFEAVAGYVQQKLGIKNLVYFSPSLAGCSYNNPYIEMTYSMEWERRYRDQGYVHIDPVFQAGIHASLPIDWNNLCRKDKIIDDFFGESMDFGIGQQGLTIPIRFHGSSMSALFTVTSDVCDREWTGYRKHIFKDVMLYASYFHSRVFEKMANKKNGRISLTKREREIISWASEGKTVEDISMILNISSETIKAHLQSVRHKTNALNTTHAVSILYRQGYIL